MTNASHLNDSTIIGTEAAHFGKMAADWWDPKGSSAMLHRLNPPRLRYIREQIDLHWNADGQGFIPLKGKRALDVGCGAGLLCEPLARLGAEVTGLDAAPENVAVAAAHAAQSGLEIHYRAGSVEGLSGETFDLVTSLEVIEHVADPARFVRGLADALAPGGLMILSTPNRTPLSKLALITLAEGSGAIPKGTHDWSKFLTPDELTALLTGAGLTVRDVRGLSYSPTKGFMVSDSTALDYFVTATR
ncbi:MULTISPECIES: bifunctional 2-polyprenyl-6-hydroxyphenol methylase/3-demethylubiquinol 3-O-methyltransferase UbiG [Sphingomonas]|jgi:2-polyprenyl-6-hydroxyphenyl methylase / 3-demethylubiquinone-9 3-methyltransferase|uniref:Ubiquinone biosynthesis O-methyltransferase n=1 Tax=Sphingomonas zeae TaxID=1646122 RepID=A0A7Y6B3H5_9SPHN|nr:MULTISPECIES: bifunctional 2-polyprenyl-6-hydroxyphenol methylase/3-demethylubiquinol 3-O-methyltransferase UbiG [Sphingomonas]MDK8187082.1 bifunctional 2-polyprenyl-6-hydroxyphenol methylase/3-demethylubiquinol 3-O-methyltransferase UbiG [Sphingomonas zeae]MDK8217440.1 bifunctional 2-polyprenyl-6-hydroxyphenol methylase/3-demethylubiquinol 3-O-methyltransferase UbiG [Sphingomonas sp. UMB7805-LC452B]NUU46578.1 bifunctional 2-polyprenyl-6-hydroxyphenol methylase/3-demethylubiquinol 3-O-methylt